MPQPRKQLAAAPDPNPPPNPNPPPPSPPRRRRSAPAPPAAGSSTVSSAAADFFADQGPQFDPESSPAPPVFADELELEPIEEVLWLEESIAEYLTMAGDVAHQALRVGEQDLETCKMTERDLQRIAPPLTRILNRYDATRAAAVMGDEGLAIAGLAAYATRNYTRRRRLIATRDAAPDVPSSGRAAEPATGPEHDPAWRASHGEPQRI